MTFSESSAQSAMGSLTGRFALVTGAGAGIGAAVVRRLAAEGAKVVGVDINRDPLDRVMAEVDGFAIELDLSQPSQIAAGIAEFAPRIDILVNNAGIQHVCPVPDFPLERWEFIQRLMLTAPFVLSQAVLPGMYARGWGRIVHLSSIHGLRASAYKSAYVAAKHGLEGLSKVIALEGAPHGVTSNCVNPGYVRTGLVEQQISDQSRLHSISADAVVSDVLLTRSPVKRLIEPEEVAAAVAYLCHPAAASITGSNQILDGGWAAQ